MAIVHAQQPQEVHFDIPNSARFEGTINTDQQGAYQSIIDSALDSIEAVQQAGTLESIAHEYVDRFCSHVDEETNTAVYMLLGRTDLKASSPAVELANNTHFAATDDQFEQPMFDFEASAGFKYFQSELLAVRAIARHDDIITEKEIYEVYHVFAEKFAGTLREKQARLRLLAEEFINPETIENESRQNAANNLTELQTKLDKLVDNKPPEGGRLHDFKRRLASAPTTENFESWVDQALEKKYPLDFKTIVTDHTASAMLFYARALYGERPFISSEPRQVDGVTLLDRFQMKHQLTDVPTKPLDPTEFTLKEIDTFISQVLYGTESPLREKIDACFADASDYERERSGFFSSKSTWDKSEGQAGWKNAADTSDPVTTTAQHAETQLPRAVTMTLHSIDRLLYGVKIDEHARLALPLFKMYAQNILVDLAHDITLGTQFDQQLSALTKRTLLQIMKDLHPDHLKEQSNEQRAVQAIASRLYAELKTQSREAAAA